jgi:ribosomal protein S18 acetylase RimI-like enzyme
VGSTTSNRQDRRPAGAAPADPRLRLRGLVSADRAPLAGLLDRLHQSGWFTAEETQVALELIDHGLDPDQQDYQFVVAEWSEAPGGSPAIVGYACYGSAPMADRVYDLYWIGVDPSHQGHHIGRALLRAVEQAVQAAQGRMLVAETGGKPSYAPTRAFYARTGFTEWARVADYYRDGDDKIIYGKRLTA